MKRLYYIKCWNSAVDNEMMNKFQFSTVHQKLLYIDVLNFAVINFILNRCKSVFPQALVKNARSLIRRRKANRPKVCSCAYWRKLQWYGIPCPFNCSISCPSFALPATHKAFCYKEKAVTKVAHTVSKPTAFSYLRSVIAMSNLLALKVRWSWYHQLSYHHPRYISIPNYFRWVSKLRKRQQPKKRPPIKATQQGSIIGVRGQCVTILMYHLFAGSTQFQSSMVTLSYLLFLCFF